MSTQGGFQDEQPQKSGMSTTAKVVLIIGSIGGVCLLLCCGGMVYLFYKGQQFVQNAVSTNPETIREKTHAIAEIDIPAAFAPKSFMDFMFMRMAIYGKGDGDKAVLMLMEMDAQMLSGGKDPKLIRQQMLQQMRAQQAGPSGMSEVDADSRETRSFTIDGQKVPFEFIKGKSAQHGTEMRQVMGAFPSKRGFVMLMLIVPDEEFDEQAVVQMIESIHTGAEAGAMAAEAEEDADSMNEDDAEAKAAGENSGDDKPTDEQSAEDSP